MQRLAVGNAHLQASGLCIQGSTEAVDPQLRAEGVVVKQPCQQLQRRFANIGAFVLKPT